MPVKKFSPFNKAFVLKKVLIITFAFISIAVNATNYYVKATGNDNNSGLSDTQAWSTITKVNSSFSGFAAGDQILFNRGDTFYGSIIISKSGTSGHPIIIGAYGSGADPIITGFTTVSGWTAETGGIYSKVIASVAQTNMVTIDGVNTGMGRYPNSTYLTFESCVTNSSITDTGLGDSPDWDGAEVVIRRNAWCLDRQVITAHTGNLITYKGGGENAIAGYGYFIQNDLRCVTDYGEWYHDYSGTGKFYLHFGTNNPSTKTIKIATQNNLIYNKGYDYITIDNISFTGSIGAGLVFNSSSDYCIIQNCSIEFAGQDGIVLIGSYNTIDGNNINNSSEAGIFSSCNYNGSHNKIINNVINGSGLIKGAALKGYYTDGIYFDHQTDGLIQYNTIDASSYTGIYFNDSRNEVRNNFVNHSLINLDDGGGIYTSGNASTGRVINGNIVLNSIGNPTGTTYSEKRSCGIYIDYNAKDVTATNNTIGNCYWGLLINTGSSNDVENNTLFNNDKGMMFSNASGNTILNNIFFAKGSKQLTLYFLNTLNNSSLAGTSDRNYYARPADDNLTIQTNVSGGTVNRTLAGWQTYSGMDGNSHKSPISITDTSNIDFYYNPTKTNKVIALAKAMIDVSGTKYVNSITLLPYTSVVLMVDPGATQPGIPDYLSSLIENSTPSVLAMTYSTALANIVPAASAFSVLVNAKARTVNAVAVSGTKVQLTLASPVVYGDVVTVSYTKPSANPLQTASGGQAATISGKTVTNNVTSFIPVYVSSAVENATPTVLAVTYNTTLANIVPAASAFSVLVNSKTRTVNAVVVSGTLVLLTLTSSVVNGDVVTVSYTKPSSNPLQTPSGGQAATISAQAVTNNVTAVIPVYVSSAVENATPSVLGMTYSITLANIIPAASAFSVRVNSSARTVNSVLISGTKVQLTLASPVVYGDVVTVSYTKPSLIHCRQLQEARLLL